MAKFGLKLVRKDIATTSTIKFRWYFFLLFVDLVPYE